MKKKKEDRRIKYTKMVLKNSLLELLKDKPIQKITVTELCRKADINRNTFYTHYFSPENLLSQIEDELFHQLITPINNEMDNESLVREMCQIIYANQELCTIIFSDSGNTAFLERVISIGHESFIREWQTLQAQNDVQLLEKIYTFVANGSVGVIQAWMRNGFRESPDEVAAFIAEMIEHLRRSYH